MTVLRAAVVVTAFVCGMGWVELWWPGIRYRLRK